MTMNGPGRQWFIQRFIQRHQRCSRHQWGPREQRHQQDTPLGAPPASAYTTTCPKWATASTGTPVWKRRISRESPSPCASWATKWCSSATPTTRWWPWPTPAPSWCLPLRWHQQRQGQQRVSRLHHLPLPRLHLRRHRPVRRRPHRRPQLQAGPQAEGAQLPHRDPQGHRLHLDGPDRARAPEGRPA